MAKKTHDVVATVGEYTTADGTKKKRYVNCGAAFTSEEGNISFKLDVVPVSPEWSGFFSLYAPRDRDGGKPEQAQPAKPTQQRAEIQHGDDSDSIPF